jgi:hypothetical protein
MDLTFAPPGNAGSLIPIPGAVPREMLAQTLPDGSMILGGIAEGTLPAEGDVESFDLDLIKLTPDGAIETSYGNGGVVYVEEASDELITPRAHDPGILPDGTFFFTRESEDRDLFQSTFETILFGPNDGIPGSQPYNSLGLVRDGNLRVTITNHDYLLEQTPGGTLDGDEVLFRNEVNGAVDPDARTATKAIFGNDLTPIRLAPEPDGSVLVLAIDVATNGDPDRTLSVFRLQRDESPAGLLDARSLVNQRDGSYRFRVQWRDEDGIDLASLGDDDVSVIFPDGVRHHARLVKAEPLFGSDGNVVIASYLITSPDGRWSAADDGRYQVRVERKSVRDTLGNPAARRIIGNFNVRTASPGPLGLMPSGR